jgi:protein-S-isoprenylcysteine O-methyltransferase Ste14
MAIYGGQDGPPMTNHRNRNLLIAGAIVAYILIGIEIIIMISPFALYFYSVYGPVLKFFASSPRLSWASEFFLPHMVFVDDPLILGLSYLQILLVIGLLLFLSAAIPLYYGRFRKKGVVRSSFYAKIRHPQYLFLAISGFGLLLYWPRFIILVMYVTMLFVYYLLARNEEWRMREEAPVLYETYMQDTPMFLPGEPGGRIYGLCLGWLKPKWLGLLLAYLLTIGLSLGLAMGIRAYTVKQLPTVTREAMVLLPVFPRPAAEVSAIYERLGGAPKISAAIAELQPNLAYIFPGDYFLTAIVTDEDRRFSDDMIERFPEVLEWHQHKFRGGLGRFFRIFYNFFSTLGTVKTDYDVERIVFVRVENSAGVRLAPRDVFKLGMQRRPVLIVDLDVHDQRLLAISKTSERHKWGDMPMPTF